jgi:hypothetical protein
VNLLLVLNLHLLGESKTDSAHTNVEVGVVVLDEDVSNNQSWTERWWELGCLESDNALGLSHIGELEDVLGVWKSIRDSSNGEGVVWELRSDSAIDLLGSSDLGEDWGDNRSGTDEERCTSIDDTVESGRSDDVSVVLLVVDGDEPVVLGLEWNVVEASSVVSWVGSSEDKLGSTRVWLVGQEEGERVLLNLGLFVGEVEDGWEVVFGDSLPGHTEDAIESGGGEVEGKVGHFSESDLGNLAGTPGNGVESNLTGDISGSVLDLHLSVLWIVGVSRGLGRVILVLVDARDFSASLGWDPKVGGTSIEDNLEVLGWCTDSDWSEVLEILDVGQRNFVRALTESGSELGSQGSSETEISSQVELWFVDADLCETEGGGDEGQKDD